MTHDNTSAVIGKFRKMVGGESEERIFDAKQPVFAIDHDIQNHSPENLARYQKIEAFAHRHGIDFYPAGTGISHQVMVEYGYATPGTLVVGSDSHSNLYGAVNSLGTPVVRTDAACIWATGETWWQVPEIARVVFHGRLQPGVVGKDVIIALCGLFNQDEVLNMAVEFTTAPGDDSLRQLTMDQRMTIANMTTEWGALAGIFPFDDVLRDYLYTRADFLRQRSLEGVEDHAGGRAPRFSREDVDRWYQDRLVADPDAWYAVELSLDLSTVVPHVSGPDHVKIMHSLPEIEEERRKIDKAYLLSCVNGRLEDISAAAAVVRGRKFADHVEFYLAAASANIQRQAEASGDWQALLDAGACPLPSGCGTCIGLGAGTLRPGEVAISATNRNFKGRMGSRDAAAYLASPAVVAASALAGYICAPSSYRPTEPVFSVVRKTAPPQDLVDVGIMEGFPGLIQGRVLWLPVDNLNTDGIYSGQLLYRDAVPPEEMAAAAMANYDPEFREIVQPGDIIVSGRNFGTGSSREQAATCLKLGGIRCVVAASFSETYKRNAFNNGFIVIECPELSDYLKMKFSGTGGMTIIGPELTIDFARALMTCEEHTFHFSSLSCVAQQLIVAGGAEAAFSIRQ